jgi:hypothetical protein
MPDSGRSTSAPDASATASSSSPTRPRSGRSGASAGDRALVRAGTIGPRAAVRSMVRYLLVDDRDGRVLAELASAQHAAWAAMQAIRGDSPVSVVRLDHEEGSLTDITSMTSMRPLPPLITRRARIKRSPDRPSQHRASTPPPRLTCPRPTAPPRQSAKRPRLSARGLSPGASGGTTS